MIHPIFKDIFYVLGLPVADEVRVCCEADMTLEVIHCSKKDPHTGWYEAWVCALCGNIQEECE